MQNLRKGAWCPVGEALNTSEAFPGTNTHVALSASGNNLAVAVSRPQNSVNVEKNAPSGVALFTTTRDAADAFTEPGGADSPGTLVQAWAAKTWQRVDTPALTYTPTKRYTKTANLLCGVSVPNCTAADEYHPVSAFGGKATGAGTVAGCMKACDGSKGCAGFNYDPANNTCLFRGSIQCGRKAAASLDCYAKEEFMPVTPTQGHQCVCQLAVHLAHAACLCGSNACKQVASLCRRLVPFDGCAHLCPTPR